MKTAAWSAVAIAIALTVTLGGQAPKSQAPRSVRLQPDGKYKVPRTPWGDPDLQGVWNDATSTPLQRPNGRFSVA